MTDAVDRALSMHEQTASARLVYLTLRDADNALTAREVAERAGISEHTAGSALGDLVGDEWATARSRSTDTTGRDPVEYRAMVACPRCDERFCGIDGLSTHRPYCGDAVTASDIKDEDVGPEDVGLDSSKPDPTEGLR
jgi:hypothetical protein